MDEQERSERIAAHIQTDAYLHYLGARIEEIRPGYSRVSLVVRAEMCNFHGMVHGGIVFGLGDIAFAAASNSHGQTAVALNVSISYLSPAWPGECLVAEAQERHREGRIGLYDIVVTAKENGRLVAQSQAMVYRKKEWFIPPPPNT
ncbi:MAG: hydroxyphenylacetyl-CoA thioesterase PaaI [Chloroflexi bacterium]|nr:MAG: hydroxyphenylacetyl-CoA thioesterase PaaI [Chloroflexota bacterium]